MLGKEALLLIGSPMRKSFSKLMNWKRMDPSKKEEMIREGETYLQFCMRLYKIQIKTECTSCMNIHTYSAGSWKEPYVQEVMSMEGVKVVRGDMCAFGMWQDSDKSEDGKELECWRDSERIERKRRRTASTCETAQWKSKQGRSQSR